MAKDKKVLKLKLVGVDSWYRPVYEDESGNLFKNTALRENTVEGLCTAYGGLDSEPDTPLVYTRHKDAEVVFL